MSKASKRGVIDRYLEIVTSARERPEMYFLPIGPIAVTHWLDGLRTGRNSLDD